MRWRAWLATVALQPLFQSHVVPDSGNDNSLLAGWWCVRIEQASRSFDGELSLMANTQLRQNYLFRQRNVLFVGLHSLDLRALGIDVPEPEQLPLVSASILARDSVLLELDARSPSIQLVGRHANGRIAGRWWLMTSRPISGSFSMWRGEPGCGRAESGPRSPAR